MKNILLSSSELDSTLKFNFLSSTAEDQGLGLVQASATERWP